MIFLENLFDGLRHKVPLNGELSFKLRHGSLIKLAGNPADCLNRIHLRVSVR